MNPETNNLPAPPPANDRAGKMRFGRLAWIGLIAVIVGLVAGFVPRLRARQALQDQTVDLATPTVLTVSPSPGKPAVGVALPSEVRPYVEAPIYARASGYLKRWLVDIGERVAAGQLLAEIDTPELDQQLAQARAELAQSQAALNLATTTATRWTELLKTASVSEQETAEKKADLELKSALVQGAQANVRRLEELKGFARVTAPFAGTITVRSTDVGQLIAAGSGRELFRLAQTQTLRIYVRVPQTMSRAVTPGQSAELTLSELPGRKFEAKVVRTAGAMEPNSRTLLTELEVQNKDNEILSGSYAQVRLTDSAAAPVMTLPSNTLLFRAEGLQVGVVGVDGKVELRPVKVGRDYGRVIEILSGITPEDRVILNPPDSLNAGITVRVASEPKNVAAR